MRSTASRSRRSGPRYITATRWLTCSTTARSWATKSTATPRSRCRSATRLRTCACTLTSSAETGSSATIRSGPLASAAAMPTRCRCPPDSWRGRRSAKRGTETDPVEQRDDPRVAVGRRADAVRVEGLADAAADRPARVEAGERVLEDGLDASAELPSLASAQRGDVGAVESDATRPSGGSVPGCSGPGWSCRSRTRRPGRGPRRRPRRATTSATADTARRAEHAAGDREGLDQAVDSQQRGHGRTAGAPVGLSTRSQQETVVAPIDDGLRPLRALRPGDRAAVLEPAAGQVARELGHLAGDDAAGGRARPRRWAARRGGPACRDAAARRRAARREPARRAGRRT